MPLCYRKIGVKRKVNNTELLKSYKVSVYFQKPTYIILLKIR